MQSYVITHQAMYINLPLGPSHFIPMGSHSLLATTDFKKLAIKLDIPHTVIDACVRVGSDSFMSLLVFVSRLYVEAIGLAYIPFCLKASLNAGLWPSLSVSAKTPVYKIGQKRSPCMMRRSISDTHTV